MQVSFICGGRTFVLSDEAAAAIRLHLNASSNAGERGLLFGSEGPVCEITEIRRLEPGDRSSLWSSDAPPVGWYVSRDDDNTLLKHDDLEFHRSLFSEKDPVLLCERLRGGNIQFRAGLHKPGGRMPSLNGWGWPLGAAAAFGLLCITAGLATHKDPPPPPVVVVAPAVGAPPPKPTATPPPPQDTKLRKLNRELSFQRAHNRRMEAMLHILRQRSHEERRTP